MSRHNKPPKEEPPKEEMLEMAGIVETAQRGGVFQVKLDDNEALILAHVNGRIRKNNIKIIPGDRVTVELSPYDLTKGRITYRFKA